MSKDTTPPRSLIRPVSDLRKPGLDTQNAPGKLSDEAIRFAEQASHDMAERGHHAPTNRATAPSSQGQHHLPAGMPVNFGRKPRETTEDKFFRIPTSLARELKREAFNQSESCGARVTETEIVIAALKLWLAQPPQDRGIT